jgi:hypothetical protein
MYLTQSSQPSPPSTSSHGHNHSSRHRQLHRTVSRHRRDASSLLRIPELDRLHRCPLTAEITAAGERVWLRSSTHTTLQRGCLAFCFVAPQCAFCRNRTRSATSEGSGGLPSPRQTSLPWRRHIHKTWNTSTNSKRRGWWIGERRGRRRGVGRPPF